MNGELCVKCGEMRMPIIHKDERSVTARVCQNCGFIQELEVPTIAETKLL